MKEEPPKTKTLQECATRVIKITTTNPAHPTKAIAVSVPNNDTNTNKNHQMTSQQPIKKLPYQTYQTAKNMIQQEHPSLTHLTPTNKLNHGTTPKLSGQLPDCTKQQNQHIKSNQRAQ